jgi:hypothetical protein
MLKSFRVTWVFLALLLVSVTPAGAQDSKNPPPEVPPLLPRAGASTTPTNARQQFTPLTGSEKWHYYLRSTYGPVSIARSVTWAGINQAMDSNPEWGQGMEGYGKRLGSKFAQYAIKRSVSQGLGAWWHEDPRYFPATSSGLWPRTLHAVGWTFRTRTDDGGEKFADARLIGTFTGALVSRTWHPEDQRTLRSGLQSGAISVGIDAGWNVFKEFWPDIRRKLRH